MGPLARADSLYYRGMAEPASWMEWLGVPHVVHARPGEQVIVFGAVFAPINLNTVTYHLWQRYDSASGKWKIVQRVDNSLRGGRGKRARSRRKRGCARRQSYTEETRSHRTCASCPA